MVVERVCSAWGVGVTGSRRSAASEDPYRAAVVMGSASRVQLRCDFFGDTRSMGLRRWDGDGYSVCTGEGGDGEMGCKPFGKMAVIGEEAAG